MKCSMCGGGLIKKKITHEEHWGKSEFYIFTDVPASVCSKCDEVYIDAKTSKKMERIVMQEKEPEHYRKVPEWSLAGSF